MRGSSMRAFLTLVVVAAAVSHANATESPYVRVPVAQLFMSPAVATSHDLTEMPVFFTFPRGFVARRTEIGILIATPADIEGVLKSKGTAINHDGLFRMDVSATVGFDAQRNQFGEASDAETAKLLREKGYLDVIVRRSKPSTFPTLEILATSGAVRIRIVYLALGSGGGVLKIAYHHPQPHRDVDDVNWEAFVSGLQERD